MKSRWDISSLDTTWVDDFRIIGFETVFELWLRFLALKWQPLLTSEDLDGEKLANSELLRDVRTTMIAEKFKFGFLPTDPGLEICKIARRTQADLILVGCHDEPERKNITRLDYVGMTILEKAPCPIMLVPP